MNAQDSPMGIDAVWQENRPYLVDLAFRMLGSIHDAEDVVQEAFARLLQADIDQIAEVRGWLVVVVSRLCLDQLRSAKSRHESTTGTLDDHIRTASAVTPDPADRVTLDASVSMALLHVMQRLSPPERAIFVLHDVFRFPFEKVAEIVGRTPATCRQIASRARRRIETETGPARFAAEPGEHHHVAAEFIAACAGGDITALMRLLDPDVVGDVDLGPDGPAQLALRGSQVLSRSLIGFFGPQTGTTLVSQPINGQPGLIAFRDRQLAAILVLDVRDDRIHDIHAIGDPAKLAFVATQLADEP
jgi:RNA polymerase sigma-70 factor (ECF subfamily)